MVRETSLIAQPDFARSAASVWTASRISAATGLPLRRLWRLSRGICTAASVMKLPFRLLGRGCAYWRGRSPAHQPHAARGARAADAVNGRLLADPLLGGDSYR